MADFSSEKSQKKLLKYKKQLRDLDRERKHAKEKAAQEKKKINEHKRKSKKKTSGGATLKGKPKTVSGGKPDWVKGSVGGDLVPSKGTSAIPQGKVMGYDVAPVDDFINTTAKHVPPKGPSSFMKGAAKVAKGASKVLGVGGALYQESAGEGSDRILPREERFDFSPYATEQSPDLMGPEELMGPPEPIAEQPQLQMGPYETMGPPQEPTIDPKEQKQTEKH